MVSKRQSDILEGIIEVEGRVDFWVVVDSQCGDGEGGTGRPVASQLSRPHSVPRLHVHSYTMNQCCNK